MKYWNVPSFLKVSKQVKLFSSLRCWAIDNIFTISAISLAFLLVHFMCPFWSREIRWKSADKTLHCQTRHAGVPLLYPCEALHIWRKYGVEIVGSIEAIWDPMMLSTILNHVAVCFLGKTSWQHASKYLSSWKPPLRKRKCCKGT